MLPEAKGYSYKGIGLKPDLQPDPIPAESARRRRLP
jgi:hypothetical protein